ncbi:MULTISPECIES: hypothetical protein [Streptomyces]|uniref:Uncharacterized protein n=2 Tax=Streptomyces TaxID=1883 RepID=A0ABV9IVV7_9ACTN
MASWGWTTCWWTGTATPVLIDGLDEDRLALCTLTQRLSLTAGPLRLLAVVRVDGSSGR